MGNWKQNSLDSFCDIVKGEQLNKLDLEKSGDYPCINGGIEPSGYTDKWNRLENTITISEGGNSCGFVNYLKTKFWSGGHCYTLGNIHDNFDLQFLYYSLKGRESKIMGLRVGSGLPNIQQKAIKSFEIKYPEEKLEQTRIAEILSTADEAIAHTEALIAKYQRIKTGLMQDLLTKGIDENGNIRSKATHRFVVKNGIEVPEEWEVDIIGSYLQDIEQGWSPNCEGDTAPTDEWGVIKTTSVMWGGFNDKENKKLPENLQPKVQFEIKNGDVLITRAGPNSRVGVVAFVKKTRHKLLLCDKIYRLVPKPDVYPEFLALAISSPYTQRHLSNLKTGMAESQTNISQKIVKDLSMVKPPFIEQLNIMNALSKSNINIEALDISLNKLLSIKTGLMQDLLSGKVRVKTDNKK